MSKNTKKPPEKNPDVGAPATAEALGVVTPTDPAHTAPPEAATVIKGADLVPNLDDLGQGRVSKEYLYWVGVTPSCPIESVTLAGINFPKMNQQLVPDPMRNGETLRRPVVGGLVRLTEDSIERMRERLKRTVIRFIDGEGIKEEPGTGQNLGDLHERPRRGHVITIPTEEQIKARRKAGRATNEYRPQAGDVPAARFMFARLCHNQVNGERGEFYPPSLETTGLAWPDEIEEQIATNELMS